MVIAKVIARKGNTIDKPKPGDTVTMDYALYIWDPKLYTRGYRGTKIDSSTMHNGPFTTQIGIGQVIKGWDEAIVHVDGGMSLGEQACFTMTSDHADGGRESPFKAPPHANLVIDVTLLAINDKTA